ncbi:CoA transferase [Kribbella lupini]|uniref:CaiB/BaiF CoA-transferase family protein n=1 Tax=Kribbella lupini TaxID=291602 RepID=A0ABN2CLV5_9ACTN
MEPLADLRILAVEQYGAGPWGTLQLADLGAEVIKIEDPRSGGDVGRYVPPHTDGEDSLFFESFNRNKRSISLDLGVPAGREVFHRLVRHSDVVFSNLRGDVPERLGLRFTDLRAINPRIVCCSLSGFGMTGPRRAEPGYDYVMQGLAGWMSLTGEPGGPPTKSGLSLVDFSTGIVAAASILAGVHAARRDGVGLDCDVSLFDTALSLTNYLATWHLTAGDHPERTRRSAHPSVVPAQVFATSDGWITLQAGKDIFWRRLLAVLGEPAWAIDSRFATLAGRHEHREVLVPLLEAEFLRRPTADWLQALSSAGIPSGPVRRLAEAFSDPQVSARDLVVETQHPTFGAVRQVRATLRAGEPRREHRRAPQRNEDTQYVLAELLKLGDDERQALTASGAFGNPAP